MSADHYTLTGSQLRAARALLGITAQQLADETKLGVATIRRAELTNGEVGMTVVNIERVIETLERLGVKLLPQQGHDGVGVRLFDQRAQRRRVGDKG